MDKNVVKIAPEPDEPPRPTQEQLRESNAQALSLKAVACPVKLQRTSEPVWPDDEQQEATERASQRRGPVPLLGEKESDAVLAAVTVALPDRLYAVRALPDDGPAVPRTHGPVGNGNGEKGSDSEGTDNGCGGLHPAGDLVGFLIPTSFSAPEDVTLRRLRLRLVLASPHRDVPEPVAVRMIPTSDVEMDVHLVAQSEPGIGKILATLVSQASDVFVARMSGTINATAVHPKIQAAGLQGNECSWRISDPRLEYDYRPAIVTQYRSWTPMAVLAELHVEVRKKVCGVWHRTYGKSAQSMWYIYRPGDQVMSAFDYLDELATAQEAFGRVLAYAPGADASSALDHLGQLLEKSGFLQESGDLGRSANDHFVQLMLEKAELWHQRANEADNALLVRKNSWDRAASWCQQAAKANNELGESSSWDERESLQGRAGEANLYLREFSWGEAKLWYRRPAEAENVDAMVHLADLLRIQPSSGSSFSANESERKSWYQRAAGYPGTPLSLESKEVQGYRRENEHRAVVEEAERQYREAAEAGSADTMAQFALELIDLGEREEAERWLREAGNDNAMLNLGLLIEGRDRKEAEGWYRRAAQAGNTAAKQKLVRLHPWRLWYRLR